MIDLTKKLTLAPDALRDGANLNAALGELADRLPDDYAEFLRVVGSFETAEGLVVKASGPALAQADSNGYLDLADMYVLSDDPESPNDLRYALDCYIERLPEGFLPIANNLTSDLFCIAVAPRKTGEVWFWRHDEDGPENDPSTMIKVADSFSEFLSLLRVDNRFGMLSDDPSSLGDEVAWTDPSFRLDP